MLKSLVLLAAVALAQAAESKATPKPDRAVKDHLEPYKGHKVHGYYPRSEWSYFHPSWSLPTFPSIPSIFKDEEEDVLLKRIESLEKSQKEILDLLKRTTDGGSNVLPVLVRTENKITNAEVPDNTLQVTNNLDKHSASAKITHTNEFQTLNQGDREKMRMEMPGSMMIEALTSKNQSGVTNVEENIARNNPDDEDGQFTDELKSSESLPNININNSHESTTTNSPESFSTDEKPHLNSMIGVPKETPNYKSPEDNESSSGSTEIMDTQVFNQTYQTESLPDVPEITITEFSNVTTQTESFLDVPEIKVTQMSNETNQTESLHSEDEVASLLNNTNNQINVLSEKDKTDSSSSTNKEQGQKFPHYTEGDINEPFFTTKGEVSSTTLENIKEPLSENTASYTSLENSGSNAMNIIGSESTSFIDLNKALTNFPASEPQLDTTTRHELEGTVVHIENPDLSVGNVSVSGEILTTANSNSFDEPSTRPEADIIEVPLQTEGLVEAFTSENDPSVNGSRPESPGGDFVGKNIFGNNAHSSPQEFLNSLHGKMEAMHERKGALSKYYGTIHRLIHVDHEKSQPNFKDQDIIFRNIDGMVQKAKLELSKNTVVPKPGPNVLISSILKPILSNPLVATANHVLNLGLKNGVPGTADKKPEEEPCKVAPVANDMVVGPQENTAQVQGTKTDDSIVMAGNTNEANSQGSGVNVDENKEEAKAEAI